MLHIYLPAHMGSGERGRLRGGMQAEMTVVEKGDTGGDNKETSRGDAGVRDPGNVLVDG